MAPTQTCETVEAPPESGTRHARVLIPEAFGQFQVLEQIGAGSLGPVYSALQLEIDCLVAVKHFTLGLQIDRAQRVLGQFDALLPTGLDHLGIAASIGTGISDGAPYLIQELARGTSLAHLGDEGRTLSVPDVLRLTVQAAEALEFAARAGVDHGGLKPADIIVTGANARVTGFGVVRALERAGVAVPARAPYASPERLAGQAWDGRSDAFSLAVIAFELLFGNATSAVDDNLVERIGPMEGADVATLRQIFERAFSADAAARFESAATFAQALQDAYDAPLGEPGPFRRRRPFSLIPRPVAPEPPRGLPESQAPAHAPEPRAQAPDWNMPAKLAPLAAAALALIEAEEAAAAGARTLDVPVIAWAPARTGAKSAAQSDDTDCGESTIFCSPVAADPESVADPVAVPEVHAVATPVRRRGYSIFWPLVFGPVAGVVIGLILAMMYVTQAPRPLSQQERLIRDRQRRAQPPPAEDSGSRPVHLRAAGPDETDGSRTAVAVVAWQLTDTQR